MEPELATTEQTEIQPINSLIPNGIENLVLRCVICTEPVPARRAAGRSKNTCGPECNKVLKQFRKLQIRRSRCPNCYHPSSPQERKEFIEWRKSRGDRREKRGRPPISQEVKLRMALQETIGWLKEELAVILECNCVATDGEPDRATLDELALDHVTKLEELIQRSEKVIDTTSSTA